MRYAARTDSTQAAERVCISLPLKIVSVANLREHWRVRANRASHQRCLTMLVVQNKVPKDDAPTEVTLTRISARALDDDNLASAFKAVRDGVADALGLKDNDKRLAWKYAQRKGKKGESAAEVTLVRAMRGLA